MAISLVHGFALSEDRARPFLEAYNQRCQPPWTAKELEHKLKEAGKIMPKNGKPRGHLLASPPVAAAVALAHGFGLSPQRALPFLQRYNQRCQPPWPQEKLLDVLRGVDADAPRNGKPRGHLL